MNTVADRLGAVNTEKKQLKQALLTAGVPLGNASFADYPAFIDLLV